MVLFGGLPDRPLDLVMIQPCAPFVAEDDILRNAKRGHERKMLRDETDAVRDGIRRRFEAHRLAVDGDRPRIRLI